MSRRLVVSLQPEDELRRRDEANLQSHARGGGHPSLRNPLHLLLWAQNLLSTQSRVWALVRPSGWGKRWGECLSLSAWYGLHPSWYGLHPCAALRSERLMQEGGGQAS